MFWTFIRTPIGIAVIGAIVAGVFLTLVYQAGGRSAEDGIIREGLENRIENIRESVKTKERIDEIPDSGLADYGAKWLLGSE